MLAARIVVGVVVGLVAVALGGLQVLAWWFGRHEHVPKHSRVIRVEVAPGQFMVGYEDGPSEARTTLIFIHGTPGSASAFGEQMAGDFPGDELVAVDRPGFGASDGSRSSACLPFQAQALHRLIEKRSYQRVILIGHSYGAPVALATALLNPKVAGVILIGGSVNPAEERPWPIQYVGDWTILRWALPRELRQCNVELLRLKQDLIGLEKGLAQIRVPVRMLHGDLDDLVPVENVAFLKQHFKDHGQEALFSSQIFPGWNHFLPWMHAPEINAQIRDFQSSLP